MVVGACSDSAFGSRQGPQLLTVEHLWGGLPKPSGSKCLGFPAKENSELLALASDFVSPFIGIPLPRHWADLWTHKVTGPALTVTGTGLRWRWHKPGVKVTVVLSLQRNIVQPGWEQKPPQLSACHSLSHDGNRAGCGPYIPKGFCILRNSRFVMYALFVVLILLCDLKLAMQLPSAGSFYFSAPDVHDYCIWCEV